MYYTNRILHFILYLLWVWATASAVAQIIFFCENYTKCTQKAPVGFIACGLYFLYDTFKEVRLVGQYIARLMAVGFSARSAHEIYKDFQAEHDFAGLNDFISILEEEKCSPYGVSIILIRQEEKSEIVPSER